MWRHYQSKTKNQADENVMAGTARSVRPIPQPVNLPSGWTQLGAFSQASGSGWATLVARVDDALASPAPKALPEGSRCIMKRRECPGIGIAEQLLRDVRPLAVLQHPNVVKYYGVLLASNARDVLLVCEFCSRGSLLDLIYHQRKLKGAGDQQALLARQKGDLFAPELVVEILVQLCLGLAYLHDDMNLAHGNLTSANVVLDGAGLVKITDVGLEDVLDSPDHDPARDAREDAATRSRRGGRGYWAPERSLANAANGGFLPVGPSAQADCWAMGCVATELVTGVFVHERLESGSSVSLAQEPIVLKSVVQDVANVIACGHCGQGGKDTCAGCRTAWVSSALLTRDPLRRPEAARCSNLLDTSTWGQGPVSTKVGSTVIPPLSIPPPWHRRPTESSTHAPRAVMARRNGVNEAELARPDSGAILAAVRQALDGPDWRVFKDGKLVPSDWHHEKIIYDITCENRTPTPHPRARPESDSGARNNGGTNESLEGSTSDERTPRRGPLSERQRERDERKGARRGLADLYKQAKDKQLGLTLQDTLARMPTKSRPPKSASAASIEVEDVASDACKGLQVPLSSLKQAKAHRCDLRATANQNCASTRSTAKKLGIGGLEGLDAMLRMQPTPKKSIAHKGAVADMDEQKEGGDLWHDWLRNLGGSSGVVAVDAVDDLKLDAASIGVVSSSAHGNGLEGWEEDEDADGDAQMGPQEMISADMQQNGCGSPQLPFYKSRSPYASNQGNQNGGEEEEEEEEEGEVEEDEAEEEGGVEAKSEEKMTYTGEKHVQKRAELWQHMVTVHNVAGNKVHVIGAAPLEPAKGGGAASQQQQVKILKSQIATNLL